MPNTNDDGHDTRPKDQDDTETSDEGRISRHTERPVAHSVKPPPPAPSTKRGFVWVAMLGLFGVVGFMLREPPSETSTSLAARAPSERAPNAALEVAPPATEPNLAPAAVDAPSEAPVEQAATTPVAPAPANVTTVAATNAPVAAPKAHVAAAPASPKLAARTLPAAPDPAPVAPSAVPPEKPAPFNHKAANASLDQSAKAASTCRRGTDPSGVARAVVTFAPSGRVNAAVISGPPFAGTETGSCIARTLRQAVIPAFTGEITTVAKTVEVQ